MTRPAARDPYAGPQVLAVNYQDAATIRDAAQAAISARPKAADISPERFAALAGYDSVDALAAALPSDATRRQLPRVLADQAALRRILNQRDALGAELPQAERLRLVVAECQRRADAASNRARQEESWRKSHTCVVLGVVDESVRPRDITSLLPTGAWGKDRTVRASDRGWAALAAALVQRAQADDTAAAARWLDGKIGEPTTPTPSKSKRPSLRRTG